MSNIATSIHELIKDQNYEQAYSVGKQHLDRSPNGTEVLVALRELTAVLRSQCMDMAAKKQDCTPDYLKLEELLSQTNELTGQDMYGR